MRGLEQLLRVHAVHSYAENVRSRSRGSPFQISSVFFSDVIMNVYRHVGKEGDTILRIVALSNGM